MIIVYLCALCFAISAVNATTYPPAVCVTGDVQADYDEAPDPRTLMGTYISINDTGTEVDTQIVDTSAPIYEHFYFGNDTGDVEQQQYLFKIKDPNGWVLAETLPEKDMTVTVFLTCFQDSLFDCDFNQWWWGYNKYEFPVRVLHVLGGECTGNMCLKNLTIQLRADGDVSDPPVTGDFSKLDGEFYRLWDNETARYQWRSRRSEDFRWYYKVNGDGQSETKTYNWVYAENDMDRIVCAPGYVEMPLFCTTFVYAGVDQSVSPPISYNPTLPGDKLGIPLWAAETGDQVTTFKMGVCGETSNPTAEPTMGPSASSNTTSPNTTGCVYEEETIGVNETVTRKCEFGYAGSGDTAKCEESGEIGDWTQGCFIISFSDDFNDFDNDKWFVYSTEGVSSQAAMALDGSSSLRFIPQDPPFIAVIRSQERIIWPMRMQATIEKRDTECNLWAVSLGPAWLTRSAYSTRVNWECSHKMSLYNHTLRFYDSSCWSDRDPDTMMMTFSVRDTGDDPGAEISAADDCATLGLQVTDILSQSPWQDAYLWLGSYAEEEDSGLKDYLNESIDVVGRFQSVQYTQFYSEFNQNMDHIWDKNASTATEGSNMMLVAPGEVAVADPNLFQFTIPFKIKLEIRNNGSSAFKKGHYAHFVSLGATNYVEESTQNVVQIVWDGNKKVRLIYAPGAVYQTGMNNEQIAEGEYYCNWDTVDSNELVMIYVDETKITVIDELCNEHNMTATHGFESNEISTFSMGFIRPEKYNEELDRIAFTLIEVYQYPVSYAGEIADGNSDSAVLEDTKQIYHDDTRDIMSTESIIILIVGSALFIAIIISVYIYLHKRKKSTHNEREVAASAADTPTNKKPISQTVKIQAEDMQHMQPHTQPPVTTVHVVSNQTAAPMQQRQQLQPMKQPETILPTGWMRAVTADGRVYYQNEFMQKTQWNVPTAEECSKTTKGDIVIDNEEDEKVPEYQMGVASFMSEMDQLLHVIESHTVFMIKHEENVDKIIASSPHHRDLLQAAKRESVAAEQQILNSILSISTINKFLEDVILIENLFNSEYSANQRAQQQSARQKYAPNLSANYEWKPKPCSKADSFVDLVFYAKSTLSSFKKWVQSLTKECARQNIQIISNSGAKEKNIERAFYKSFYVYGAIYGERGYLQMTDMVRCSLVFDDFDHLYHTFAIIENMMKENGAGGILRCKDRFHPEDMPCGYRDLLINICCPGSDQKVVCEVQLHHQLFYQHKEISHSVYKIARIFEDQDGKNMAYDYSDHHIRKTVGDKLYKYEEKENAASESKEHQLLKQWSLNQYTTVLIDDNGWADAADWSDLSEKALLEMNFKAGHAKKFMRMVSGRSIATVPEDKI